MAGVVVAAVVITAVLVTVYWRIRATGRIKAIGLKVCSDLECTQEVASIDWGELAPGDVARSTVYIKNTGNAPANITLSTEKWVPAAAEQHLALAWDYDGHELQVGEVVLVNMDLTVSGTIVGVTEFSFDIIIEATG